MTQPTTQTPQNNKALFAMQTLRTLLADLNPATDADHCTDRTDLFRVGGVSVFMESGRRSWHPSVVVVNVADWKLRDALGAKPRRYTKLDAANVEKIAATIRDLVQTVADTATRLNNQRTAEEQYRARVNAVHAPLVAQAEAAKVYGHQVTTNEVRKDETFAYVHRLNVSYLSVSDVLAILTAVQAREGNNVRIELNLANLSTAQTEAALQTLQAIKANK